MTGRRQVSLTPSGDVVLSALVCAELLALVRSPVRGALAPAAAEAAELIERVGAAHRYGSDLGPSDAPGPDLGSRSSGDLLDSRTAADMLGVSDRHVRRLARSGRLSGVELGPGWTFRRADVVAYRDGGVSDAAAC